MTVPSNLEFTNGSDVYYRMRSIDSTNAISDWTEGWFTLPNHDVILNSDGTATLIIDHNDLGLENDLILDAQVDERSKNSKFGTSTTMQAELDYQQGSSNPRQAKLRSTRITFQLDNHRCEPKSNKSFFEWTPELSIHDMTTDGLWLEEEITWNRAQNSLLWIPAEEISSEQQQIPW